ncbi:MAG: DUF2163 domain-containing protein, partial [Pseudomonadota bacterium]
MKSLPAGLAVHLATGATSLCTCWKITRQDGQSLGFTDHDETISFDGVTFAAATGLLATAEEASAGLAVDNSTVLGALDAAGLTETDLSAGLYDNADVEIYRVNWADPAQRYLHRKGTVGEVTRGGLAFTAEVRGLAHALDQTVGRVYQNACDADLGDSRCGVDLETASYKGAGVVTSASDPRRFVASGLGSFQSGWFSRGLIVWTSGANAGRSADVKQHVSAAGAVTFELWRPMSEAVAPSDGFTVTAGCDKQAATCRDRFANLANFRGF